MGRVFPVSSMRAPKSIINSQSTAGFACVPFTTAIVAGNKILSGALAANTFKTLLTVTGSGILRFVGAYCLDATGRILGLKLTIDGTVVFSSTSYWEQWLNKGVVAVGGPLGNDYVGAISDVFFSASCIVAVSSSLSETDKVAAVVNYEVY